MQIDRYNLTLIRTYIMKTKNYTVHLLIGLLLFALLTSCGKRYLVTDKNTGEVYITHYTKNINDYYLQDAKFSKWCNGRLLAKEIELK